MQFLCHEHPSDERKFQDGIDIDDGLYGLESRRNEKKILHFNNYIFSQRISIRLMNCQSSLKSSESLTSLGLHLFRN